MARSESPSISVSRRGVDSERTVVWVSGDHDIATKVVVATTIARAAQIDDGDLYVDLSGVTFMDASLVGVLVGAANRLRSRSRSLEVRAPSPSARRVLDLCGLAHLGRSAVLNAVHPSGSAAALGTWIDVPLVSSGEAIDRDAEGVVAERARASGLDPDAQPPEAAVKAEVDRVGP